METLLYLPLAAVGAVAFDWAFHFEVQVIHAAASGKATTPYELGPPSKLCLMGSYLVAGALLVERGMRDGPVWLVVFIAAVTAYVIHASVRAIRQMN